MFLTFPTPKKVGGGRWLTVCHRNRVVFIDGIELGIKMEPLKCTFAPNYSRTKLAYDAARMGKKVRGNYEFPQATNML